MSDQYVETSHKGFLDRIVGSFVGVLFGIALFFGSFVLLWWNEGRTDLSTIANKAIPIAQAATSSDYVFITDEARVTRPLGISATGGLPIPELKPGEYLAVKRVVEMYAWEETRSSKTKKNVGGSTDTTTTYSYNKRWVENPEPASKFKKPHGHDNPQMPVRTYEQKAPNVFLGRYQLKSGITLPGAWETLSTGNSALVSRDWAADGEYFYDSPPSTPRIGSIRMKFMVEPAGKTMTAFGRLVGNTLMPHTGEHEKETFRLFEGDKLSAVDTLRGEYMMWMWICRVGGFLMMFIGMNMIIGPISTLLDVLPFLGTVGRGIGGMVLFPIAAVLSIVTIAISMLVHSLVAMIIVGILGLVGAAFYLRKRAAKKMSPAEPPPLA